MRDYFFFVMVSFGLVFLYGSGCGETAKFQPKGAQTVSDTIQQTPTDDPSPDTKIPIPAGIELDEEEKNFLTLINKHREQAGLNPLVISVTLTQASEWMSEDMALNGYFSHTDSQGRNSFTRMADFGYSGSSMGENIAAGNASAADTFNQWKYSLGHNANMLGTSYRSIGIGRYYRAGSAYQWYWTTDFGNSIESEKSL